MILPAVRQLLFPRPFRIAKPKWRIEPGTLQEFGSPPDAADQQKERHQQHLGLDPQALAELCTGVWKLRQRMLDPKTGEARPEYRRAFFPMRDIWTALQDRGVEIIDHTNQDYDAGLSLRVTTMQPVAGLESERVIKTMQPTVYLGEERIQVGEVVVGIPE